MKTFVDVVGVVDAPEVTWPKGWQIPRIGDSVFLRDVEVPLSVRATDWLPQGDEGSPDPFVYIVIGPSRP
jgi:hypothetical protein